MFKNKLFLTGLLLTIVGATFLIVAFYDIIHPFYYMAACCFYLGSAILIYSYFIKN